MELLMVFVGGLLGSSHCVGMCGGFVVSLGAASPSWRLNLLRQLTYSLGRVFTYASAGAMAGYGGWRLTRSLPPLVHVQSWLAVLAGVLLVIQGLLASGLWRRLLSPRQRPCLTAGLFARFLSGRFHSPWALANVFLAGSLNGLLPCGLVYAYLALATSTGNMLAGFVHMALFGLGTLPIMVLTGCGGGLLSLAGRRRLLHLAAFCVIATGGISIWRGAAFLSSDAQIAAAKCPACSASE
ncbi:MAG TPA: sulfite exporter TauE/SafE family protein [Pirellulales bacterium]|nr:sulfite exporter TauE/SafE family protein [Pirellulales bacterium]